VQGFTQVNVFVSSAFCRLKVVPVEQFDTFYESLDYIVLPSFSQQGVFIVRMAFAVKSVSIIVQKNDAPLYLYLR